MTFDDVMKKKLALIVGDSTLQRKLHDLSVPLEERAFGASDAFRKMLSDTRYEYEDWPGSAVSAEAAELQVEVALLQRTITQQTEALRKHEADAQSKEDEIVILREALSETESKYKDRQGLFNLINQVRSNAEAKLLNDEAFRKKFLEAQNCHAYVLSIDIRRSTALMLKAVEPRRFAEFLTELAQLLKEVIVANYGVFDKFTGDGILAFFPDFYSGDDAGFYAVTSAAQCHAIFTEHYRQARSKFKSVLLDVGLGIGIDFGVVQIVEIGGTFTVVGEPVVYACRLGGAEAGQTYLNQSAYDQVFQRYAPFDYDERELTIKHEGRTLAYSVRPNGKSFTPKAPSWETEPPPVEEPGSKPEPPDPSSPAPAI